MKYLNAFLNGSWENARSPGGDRPAEVSSVLSGPPRVNTGNGAFQTRREDPKNLFKNEPTKLTKPRSREPRPSRVHSPWVALGDCGWADFTKRERFEWEVAIRILREARHSKRRLTARKMTAVLTTIAQTVRQRRVMLRCCAVAKQLTAGDRQDFANYNASRNGRG